MSQVRDSLRQNQLSGEKSLACLIDLQASSVMSKQAFLHGLEEVNINIKVSVLDLLPPRQKKNLLDGMENMPVEISESWAVSEPVRSLVETDIVPNDRIAWLPLIQLVCMVSQTIFEESQQMCGVVWHGGRGPLGG